MRFLDWLLFQDFVSTDNKNIGEELVQLGAEAESLEDKRSKCLAEIKSIDEKLRQLGNEIAEYVSRPKCEGNRGIHAYMYKRHCFCLHVDCICLLYLVV